MNTIDIAVATHRAQGLERVSAMLQPPRSGVRYIVSWQHCDGSIPAALSRPDVELHCFDGEGVSANRNNALRNCRADIVLMADDDLEYAPGFIDNIFNAFNSNPEIDFATFRFTGNCKSYPSTELPLPPWPRNYSVTTFEIAARREALLKSGVTFDTRFGPGSGVFESGEDEIFMLTMLRRGLKGRFFPVTICRHEGMTTGFRTEISREIAHGFGGVIGMMYPVSGALRVPLKAWRLMRAGRMPFFSALLNIGVGYIRSLFIKRPWKK